MWGFVAGVFRRFLRPTVNQESGHNGHYGGHGFKFQMVVAPDGMLVDVAGPYSARINDSEITRECFLEDRLSEFCTIDGEDFLIYGDPADSRSQYIQKPFRRISATTGQRRFDATMSAARIAVGHAIGTVTQTSPAIDFVRTERCGKGEVAKKYLVAVIFRNLLTIIAQGNQIPSYFDCLPPTMGEFLAERTHLPPCLVALGEFEGVDEDD